MRIWVLTMIGIVMLFPVPVAASWRAANAEVAAAARMPRIAAALAAADRMDRAILTRDAKEFSAVFADDAVANQRAWRSECRAGGLS